MNIYEKYENTRFSHELKLHFYIKLDGTIVFEDGVSYDANEVYQLKRLRHDLNDEVKYAEWVNKIHRMKKFFDTTVGLIMPLN